MKKVLKIDDLEISLKKDRAAGKKIILTNGCFDILHIGHARYLKKARELGDLLIVGVNSDQSVKKLKGAGRPLNNEQDRAELLSYFYFVDYVTIFSELTADNLLLKVRPNFYVKGGDYTKESLPESATLDCIQAKAVFISFVEGYSTTKIIEKSKN